MVGFIKHFYEYGKPHYTATTKFNEIESKFSYSG
jgi:hypothetical protein